MDCCICLETFDLEDDCKAICGHFVCEGCTENLVRLNCPLCRAELKSKYTTEFVKDITNLRKSIEDTIAQFSLNIYWRENAPPRRSIPRGFVQITFKKRLGNGDSMKMVNFVIQGTPDDFTPIVGVMFGRSD